MDVHSGLASVLSAGTPYVLSKSVLIDHDLYLLLIERSYAVATYLLANDLVRDDNNDRDALKRAADHVTALMGYKGVDADDVSDALCSGLHVKLRQPQRYELSPLA